MNVPLVTLSDSSLDSLCRALARNAVAEDQSGGGIHRSTAQLREAGLLNDSGVADPAATAKTLMRIAGANLSVARLYEGHINALRLIELHGDRDQRRRMNDLISKGSLLGVWGAEGAVPLETKGGALIGSKTFASGLGTVTHAIVTVDGFAGRIGLITVDDTSRQTPQDWQMPGMRATRSGGFDFTGMDAAQIDWIGAPGCYPTEPGFVTGVWRIAALQLGGALGLIETAAQRLRQLGRMGAEAQLARMTPLMIRALAADGLVLKAARLAESDAASVNPQKSVALSISARLLTEDLGQQTISAVEQSIGLGHFDSGSETGRIARDLAVYMRQAARDAFLQRAGAYFLCRDASVWEMFDE